VSTPLRDRGNQRAAWLFLLPNFLGFLIFGLVPLVLSLAGSFTTWSLRPAVPLQFVGFTNYIELFRDRNFYFYLYNTAYLMLGLPVSIAGALTLAVLLNQRLNFKGPRYRPGLAAVAAGVGLGSAALLWVSGARSLAYLMFALAVLSTLGFLFGSVSYRTFFYLPHFTAGAATILLWTQLYNPNFGLINQTLRQVYDFLGVTWEVPGWLTSTKSLLGFLPLPAHFNNGGFGLGAREAIMIMGIWGAIGGNTMLLYLAGLSNIPPDLYEAADIDGASAWQRFWHITFPQLAPTTFFVTIMGLIGGLQGGFEQARLMTQGGPAGTTTTISYYIFTQGFERLDLGYGAAVAWVLFVMILVMTLVNWKYGSRRMGD
jgi:multiple sugar transport system permease protein